MINLEQYRRDGYVHLRNLFDHRSIDTLRMDALDVFRRQAAYRGLSSPDDESLLFRLYAKHFDIFVNCGKQVQHLMSLHRLALGDDIEQILHRLGLESPNISTRPVLYFNHRDLARREVYWRVFAHQDWRSMQGSLDAVVVWIPLVDIDQSLGALQFIPGSHRQGLMTSAVEESFGKVTACSDADFRTIEVNIGDAIVFSSFLVHRSGTNNTDRIRWSCHFRYNNLAEETFTSRGYPHPYTYKPADELLTPGFPLPEDIARLFP